MHFKTLPSQDALPRRSSKLPVQAALPRLPLNPTELAESDGILVENSTRFETILVEFSVFYQDSTKTDLDGIGCDLGGS